MCRCVEVGATCCGTEECDPWLMLHRYSLDEHDMAFLPQWLQLLAELGVPVNLGAPAPIWPMWIRPTTGGVYDYNGDEDEDVFGWVCD